MRKWLVVFMSVIALGLGEAMFWMYSMKDNAGPEIMINDSKENMYRPDMTTEELLEGVKAMDEKDGDVSDSLMVENVYPNDTGDKVTVVFVSKDSSKNVTKKNFSMTADAEEFKESEDEKQPGEDASEELDSDYKEDKENREDISEKTESEETEKSEESQPDEEMTEEEKAQQHEEEKLTKLNPQDPRFYLSTYYLKVSRGTSIDRLSYVKDIQDDKDASNELYRKIQITGNVDVNTPGTYELTYYVIDSDGNVSNGAVLTIVVE